MRYFKQILSVVFNHEIWFSCGSCGCEYDVRKSDYCDTCGYHNL